MPIKNGLNKLYKVPEIISSLRTQLDKNPIARICEQGNGKWFVEICDGTVRNPIFIGYLCQNDQTSIATFDSREEAINSISWCSDIVDIL